MSNIAKLRHQTKRLVIFWRRTNSFSTHAPASGRHEIPISSPNNQLQDETPVTRWASMGNTKNAKGGEDESEVANLLKIYGASWNL